MTDTYFEDATHATSLDGDEALGATDDPSGTPADVYVTPADLAKYTAEVKKPKLSVTVSTNDLIVALKHKDDSDPSATNPLHFVINDTVRSVTSALSITIPDGTNWFNSGGLTLGTLVVPYFVYVVWDSISSAVALTIARKPHYRVIASGMTTNNIDTHVYGYAGFTDGDDMANIGYFEATLSLSGTGHLWTVPAFTGNNLRHEQTFESQEMTWTPTAEEFSGTPTVNFAQYRVNRHQVRYDVSITGTSDGTALTITAPFLNAASFNITALGGFATDGGTPLTTAYRLRIASGTNVIDAYSDTSSGAWTGSSTKSVIFFIESEI